MCRWSWKALTGVCRPTSCLSSMTLRRWNWSHKSPTKCQYLRSFLSIFDQKRATIWSHHEYCLPILDQEMSDQQSANIWGHCQHNICQHCLTFILSLIIPRPFAGVPHRPGHPNQTLHHLYSIYSHFSAHFAPVLLHLMSHLSSHLLSYSFRCPT